MKKTDEYLVKTNTVLSADNTLIVEKDTPLESVIDTFKYLKSEECTVVITDRYLFARIKDEKQFLDYVKDVSKILLSLKAKKIIFVCNKNNAEVKNAIISNLQEAGTECVIISGKYDIHDRCWINVEKKRAVICDSMNALHKVQTSIIAKIFKSDVEDLLRFLKDII